MRVNSNLWDNSLNWPNLYDANAFFQFRVLIQIQEVISFPNHSRDTLTLIKLNTLHSWKGCVRVNSNFWYNSLNWLNLYDAIAYFQFRVLIRILEVISIPNHSRDTLTLLKLNTLHSWKWCVRVNSNLWYNSLNWLNLYNANAFFQFQMSRILEVIYIRTIPGYNKFNKIEYFTNMERVCESLIQILEVISIPNHSRDTFTLIKLTTYHLWKEGVIVNSNLWYNSLNWLNLYDEDAFFQFRGLIRILEVIYIPNHSRVSFI